MKPGRRSFLFVAGGAAAAAATLAAKTPTSLPQTNQKAKPARAGYELTAHIRNYYRTASI